jgi:hypothetical protein
VPLTEDSEGERLAILDLVSPGPDFVNIIYNNEDKEYRFNITRHVQGLLEGTVESNAIYLVAEHPFFGTTNLDVNVPIDVRRSVIDGFGGKREPRLVLTFTD